MARRRRATAHSEVGLPVRDVVRRRWLWGVLTFLLIATPLVGLVSFLPDAYRSTATVLIERQQIPDELVRTTVTSALETRLHMITQQILSRPNIEALATRFTLTEDFEPGTSQLRITERVRSGIQIEIESSKVHRDPGGAAAVAFTVSYSGRNPEKTALVANALALAFVEENLSMRRQEASGTAAFLRQQLDSTKRQLEEQERRVSAFKERYAGELPEQLNANLATLEQLNVQLRLNSENQLGANERRAALVKQLNEAEGMAPAGGADAAGNRLLQLKQSLAILEARYSDKYPDVIRVRSEIESLEEELRNVSADPSAPSQQAGAASPLTFQLRQSLDAVDVEIKRLKAEQDNLRASLVEYQRRVEWAPRREQESQAMIRDYDTTKELYRSLVARERESQLAEEMEQRRKGEQFRIIEPALVPLKPTAPQRGLLIPLVFPAAVLLAAVVMLVREWTDPSLHSARDLEALSPIPVVASIPVLRGKEDNRLRNRRVGLTAASMLAVLMAMFALSYLLARDNDTLTSLLMRANS
jgi:polysaccharide chain length determinant protein (PEP-CTERM system associated)